MNALKLWLNATIAGLYGALVLGLFLRATNADFARGGGLALVVIIAVYALASGVAWALVYGALRFFASHPLRLSWLNLRYLMAFHVVNSALLIGACWTTVSRRRPVLEPGIADSLEFAYAAMTLAWLFALIVSAIPRLRRSMRVQGVAAAAAVVALLPPVWLVSAVPAGSAGGAPSMREIAPEGHLVLLNFDGADLEDLLTLESRGIMPAFSRLRETGSFGRLKSLKPCLTPVTRTTLITGKLPYRHGVRDAFERRILGGSTRFVVTPAGIGFDWLLAPFQTLRALSSADRRSLALWEIASRMGGAGLASGWDIDLDVPALSGTPRFDLLGGITGLADLIDVENVRRDDPEDLERIGILSRALRADERVSGMLAEAGTEFGPGIVAISFPGLDRVAHTFLRYARPADFGNVSDPEIDRYGQVMEGYYRRIDTIVERVLAGMDENATLFVTSSHGIEPQSLRHRFLGEVWGGERLSGTHVGAPGGFLFARGPQIRHGHSFGSGSIADVVPTALYALGMPVARDLDGKIRTGIFTPQHTGLHAVPIIDSYESGR